MDDKILSIIIPVYNCEKDIASLLEVLQILDIDSFEIITVNDGSKDNSLNVLYYFQESMPNLVVLNQDNQGVSAARNAGISQAKGTLISFFDADDSIKIEELKKMINKLTISKSDLTIFGLIDRFIDETSIIDVKTPVHTAILTFQDFLMKFGIYLNESILYSPCNKIYKREIIHKNNILFNTNYALGEDILFNLTYFSFCSTIEFYDGYIYIYNHFHNRKETGSTKYRENELEIFVEVLTSIELFLDNQNALSANRKELNRFYIRRMNSLISSLFNPSCNLSYKGKISAILEICNESLFVEAANAKINNLGIKICILKTLYKYKLAHMIYFIFNNFH